MKILGIDTSSKYLSVGLLENHRLLGLIHHLPQTRRSLNLVSMIKQVLKDSGLNIKDIDAFCVSKGPGSFTGLRVGISAVKGFGMALKKPVLGIPTLDVIANNLCYYQGRICVIVDAKKSRVYWALYQSKYGNIKRISRYKVSTIDEVLNDLKGDIFFVGDGINLYSSQIEKCKNIKPAYAEEELWYPRADSLLRLGIFELKKGKRDKAKDLVPLYIYPRECTVTRKK